MAVALLRLALVRFCGVDRRVGLWYTVFCVEVYLEFGRWKLNVLRISENVIYC